VRTIIDNEISTIKSLSINPYIVNLVETFWEDGYFYLIYEYCAGGNLDKKLKE